MGDTATRDQLTSERSGLIAQYVSSTKFWITGESGSPLKDPDQVQSVRQRRRDIEVKLKANYWRLDPYVRARSLYDRIGIIKPDGSLQFYPSG